MQRAVAGLGCEFVCARQFAGRENRARDNRRYAPRQSGGRLRVIIDRDGGVTLADCARVSRELSAALAAEGVAYEALEVSSPGPNRPLIKADDFRRFAGQSARITLKESMGEDDSRRRFRGQLLGENDGVITLECGGEQMQFAMAQIEHAELSPDDIEINDNNGAQK